MFVVPRTVRRTCVVCRQAAPGSSEGAGSMAEMFDEEGDGADGSTVPVLRRAVTAPSRRVAAFDDDDVITSLKVTRQHKPVSRPVGRPGSWWVGLSTNAPPIVGYK